MASFFRTQDIVHIKDIVAVLIVVAVVLDALTRLCEDATGVARRLVLEFGVANAVGGRQMRGQRLERLKVKPLAHSIKGAEA